jgi:hypothetical protein
VDGDDDRAADFFRCTREVNRLLPSCRQ